MQRVAGGPRRLAGRELLTEAKLLREFCFKRKDLPTGKLDYEPRHSCQCKEPGCAAVWVASKSGEVMRIAVPTQERPQVKQTWLPGSREARAIVHVHDGEPLGDRQQGFLVIGRDDGVMEIVPDRDPDWTEQPPDGSDPPSRARAPARGGFHLDTWWKHREQYPVIDVRSSIARDRRAVPRYTVDITAIAVLARPGQRGTIDIVVATRYPWLYVIEVTRGEMRLRQRLCMPGWIQWIISGEDRVTCVSRGGDIVRFPRKKKRILWANQRSNKLSLLPTAAMAFEDRGLLIGTTTGLFLLCDDHAQAIAVPVTREPILCLARAEVHDPERTHDYITMGLENRRMHVVHAELLSAMAHGNERPEKYDHYFAVEVQDAVLEVQTLRPDDGWPSAAYVLAALRDHSICLFHVTAQDAQRRTVRRLWRAHVRDSGHVGLDGRIAFADEIAVANQDPPRNCDRHAWAYMLVDEVLPRLCDEAPEGSPRRRQIVDAACNIARYADHRGLYRLSATLGLLAGNDLDLLLRLSRSVLGVGPQGDEHRWAAFVEYHLRALNALTPVVGNADEIEAGLDDSRARLVSWVRFVRKYILLGKTFAIKQLGLSGLVEQNYQAHKYLDALIYQTRLAQQCYDLRWTSDTGDDVADLHAVDWRPRSPGGTGCLLVVVVTVRGRLAFLDGKTGCRLTISDHGERRDVLTPFASAGGRADGSPHEPIRTFASAVARDDDRLRIVVSCAAPYTRRPALAVLDVRWTGSATSPVKVLGPTSTIVSVERPRICAIAPVPGDLNTFVVGLDAPSTPVGLLRAGATGWTIELASDASPDDQSSPKPLAGSSDEIPTRALSVRAIDDRPSSYVAVAGSDDGWVRAFSFASGDATSWKVERWEQMTAAVTSVALGRSDELAAGRDHGKVAFTCYLGTAAGDTLALSIAARSSGGADAPLFPGHDFEMLWRDTHDGPVLAVRLWRTPLYPSSEVLIAATKKGRLCVYHHSSTSDDGDRKRLSTRFDYVFRGMRFARVRMPDQLCALAIADDRCELVASRPGGRLYLANMLYLQESDDRSDSAMSPPSSLPGDQPLSELELPRQMWPRLHHLFAATHHEWLDKNRADPQRPKLELFELIRLDRGALSSYVLWRWLMFHDPWNGPTCDQEVTAMERSRRLKRKARQLLRALDPNNPEHAERIKVVLKSLCRAFLLQEPDGLRKRIIANPRAVLERNAETCAMCELVARYLAGRLAYPRRLRMVAIKELLRVPILWHMARDDDYGERVRRAIESALDSCLRDEDHLVRFEALGAVSVMLRNVAVMAELAGDARDTLIDALFPRGLDSVAWLLRLIVGSLRQLPGFTRRSALVGSAWYYISALLPLFQIFRNHSLALCDYLIRHGLGLRAVAVCHQAMRHPGAEVLRDRIENLYLLPVLRPQHTADDYLERYHTQRKGHAGLRAALHLEPGPASVSQREWHEYEWYEIDDARMAERRLQLLDQLAHMWSVAECARIPEMARFRSTSPVRATRDAPLGYLERAVSELASIAGDLENPETRDPALKRLDALGNQDGSGIASQSELTAPIRRTVAGIVGVWRKVSSSLPSMEKESGASKLRSMMAEGDTGTVFPVDQPSVPGDERERPASPPGQPTSRPPARLRTPTATEPKGVRRPRTPEATQLPREPRKVPILFMGANPSDDARMALDREVEAIHNRLRGARHFEAFVLHKHFELRAEDLQARAHEHQPRIVHFSGHGTRDGKLVFQDNDRTSAPMSIQLIADQFRLLRDQFKVDCVVLAACYSRRQAKAISARIPVVIGMSNAIRDDDAIAFSGSFYEALGYGDTVKMAFAWACNQMKIAREKRARQKTDRGSARDVHEPGSRRPRGKTPMPQLLERRPSDAARLRFVELDPARADLRALAPRLRGSPGRRRPRR